MSPEAERRIKRRTRELLDQWRTARWGMGEEEVAEDWARERALLEAEVAALTKQEAEQERPLETWPSLAEFRQMSPSEVNHFFASIGCRWRVRDDSKERPL